MKSIRSFLLLATAAAAAIGLVSGAPAHAGGISKVCVMSGGRAIKCFSVKTTNINAMRSRYACDEPNGLRCEALWGAPDVN